jgi:hypothetical protein
MRAKRLWLFGVEAAILCLIVLFIPLMLVKATFVKTRGITMRPYEY